MEKTIFGKTKLEVSPITLGTWGIGGAGWDDYPDEMRLDTIKAAVEAGINLIDTAPAYNGGRSEQCIGRALEQIGARKDVYIVTKTGNDFIDGQYVRNGKADNIFALCERSLRNLRTDYIDILLLHWPDPKVSLEETFGAMNRLKEQGIIGHIGASNLTKDQMIEAEKYTEIEVYQPHFSMLTQENEETISWAHEKGIGVMAYGSLGRWTSDRQIPHGGDLRDHGQQKPFLRKIFPGALFLPCHAAAGGYAGDCGQARSRCFGGGAQLVPPEALYRHLYRRCPEEVPCGKQCQMP